MSIQLDQRNKIARAAGIVSGASIIIYIVSFSREIAISMRFGTSAVMDAYLVAQTIPMFLALALSSVIQPVVIPLFASYKNVDPVDADRFINKTFGGGILASLLLWILLAAGSPFLIPVIAPGFNSPQLLLATRLMWSTLPIILLSVIAGLFAGLFYAEKEFFIPGILQGMPALVIVISVLTLGGVLGIYSLAVGLVGGTLFQAVLGWILLRRRGFSLRPDWEIRDEHINKLLKLSFPLLVGALSTGLIPLIDRSMASTLSTGSISSLGYAERMTGIVIMVFGSIQTAVLPFFAEQASKKNFQQMKKDFYQTSNLIFFVLLPMCVLLVFFNQNLVRLFLQRGAFDAQATLATGSALIGYTLGLLPYTIGLVGVRLAQATFNNNLIGLQGALNPFLKVGLNLLLIPLWGHVGIAVATSGMYLVGSIIILAGVSIKMHVEFKWRFLVPLGKMIVSLTGSTAFLLITRILINRNIQNWWLDLEYISGLSLLSLLIYVGLCNLLKLEEARFLPLLIKHSFNRLESAWSRKY